MVPLPRRARQSQGSRLPGRVPFALTPLGGRFRGLARRRRPFGRPFGGAFRPVQFVPRRLQRPHEKGAHVRRQTAPHAVHAIFRHLHAQVTARRDLRVVIPCVRSRLRRTPRADEALDLTRRVVQGELHQALLVLVGGDAGQSPNLGPGEAPLLHFGGSERQTRETPGDPHPFARRAGRHARAPGQPVRAGDPPAPAFRRVEALEQCEKPVLAGVQVSAKVCDLVAEGTNGRPRCVVGHGVPPKSVVIAGRGAGPRTAGSDDARRTTRLFG